jgi:hypothetical protein
MSGNPALSRLADWLIEGAPVLAILFVAVAAFALFRELDLRRLRQTQSQLESIRAEDYARDKPIGLVGGQALMELVETIQKGSPGADASWTCHIVRSANAR